MNSLIIAWLLNSWEGSFRGHYLHWSLNMKSIRLINVALIIWTITYLVLRPNSTRDERLRDACLLALYFSFTFLLFDFLCRGISKGYGLGYVEAYWFIAAFYPLFWIEIPLVGWFMKRNSARETPVE